MNEVAEVRRVVVPVFVTRQEVSELLGVPLEAVKRLDYEGYLKRAKGFAKPVRYTGKSVRDLING